MFYETPRFPDQLAYGLLVGPAFRSDVIRVASGAESRNQVWERELQMFDGSTTHRTQDERNQITAFFRAMRGRVHGFRIKDWSDFRVDAGEGVLQLVTGETVEYQMYKRYASGGQVTDRIITKPVAGPSLAVQGPGTYTIDTTTGIVTASGGAPTGWTGYFDVPVRFDQDELLWQVEGSAGGRVYIASSLKLIEIRQ